MASSSPPPLPNGAYVTLVTSESYAEGALVLAGSLRDAGTQYPLVVLHTSHIRGHTLSRLRLAFDALIPIDPIVVDDPRLALLQRPELNISFTKLWAWTLIQYDKIVFLDADTLVLTNVDDLMLREPDFCAAPDSGWPDIFNSGVFVARPSMDTFEALRDHLRAHGSFDGGDQGLLNSFFGHQWRSNLDARLPFTDNVTPSASYQYVPAYREFQSQVRILHFIGAENKPWRYPRLSSGELVFPPGLSEDIRTMVRRWWAVRVTTVQSWFQSRLESLSSTWQQQQTSSTTTSTLHMSQWIQQQQAAANQWRDALNVAPPRREEEVIPFSFMNGSRPSSQSSSSSSSGNGQPGDGRHHDHHHRQQQQQHHEHQPFVHKRAITRQLVTRYTHHHQQHNVSSSQTHTSHTSSTTTTTNVSHHQRQHRHPRHRTPSPLPLQSIVAGSTTASGSEPSPSGLLRPPMRPTTKHYREPTPPRRPLVTAIHTALTQSQSQIQQQVAEGWFARHQHEQKQQQQSQQLPESPPSRLQRHPFRVQPAVSPPSSRRHAGRASRHSPPHEYHPAIPPPLDDSSDSEDDTRPVGQVMTDPSDGTTFEYVYDPQDMHLPRVDRRIIRRVVVTRTTTTQQVHRRHQQQQEGTQSQTTTTTTTRTSGLQSQESQARQKMQRIASRSRSRPRIRTSSSDVSDLLAASTTLADRRLGRPLMLPTSPTASSYPPTTPPADPFADQNQMDYNWPETEFDPTFLTAVELADPLLRRNSIPPLTPRTAGMATPPWLLGDEERVVDDGEQTEELLEEMASHVTGPMYVPPVDLDEDEDNRPPLRLKRTFSSHSVPTSPYPGAGAGSPPNSAAAWGPVGITPPLSAASFGGPGYFMSPPGSAAAAGPLPAQWPTATDPAGPYYDPTTDVPIGSRPAYPQRRTSSSIASATGPPLSRRAVSSVSLVSLGAGPPLGNFPDLEDDAEAQSAVLGWLLRTQGVGQPVAGDEPVDSRPASAAWSEPPFVNENVFDSIEVDPEMLYGAPGSEDEDEEDYRPPIRLKSSSSLVGMATAQARMRRTGSTVSIPSMGPQQQQQQQQQQLEEGAVAPPSGSPVSTSRPSSWVVGGSAVPVQGQMQGQASPLARSGSSSALLSLGRRPVSLTNIVQQLQQQQLSQDQAAIQGKSEAATVVLGQFVGPQVPSTIAESASGAGSSTKPSTTAGSDDDDDDDDDVGIVVGSKRSPLPRKITQVVVTTTKTTTNVEKRMSQSSTTTSESSVSATRVEATVPPVVQTSVEPAVEQEAPEEVEGIVIVGFAPANTSAGPVIAVEEAEAVATPAALSISTGPAQVPSPTVSPNVLNAEEIARQLEAELANLDVSAAQATQAHAAPASLTSSPGDELHMTFGTATPSETTPMPSSTVLSSLAGSPGTAAPISTPPLVSAQLRAVAIPPANVSEQREFEPNDLIDTDATPVPVSVLHGDELPPDPLTATLAQPELSSPSFFKPVTPLSPRSPTPPVEPFEPASEKEEPVQELQPPTEAQPDVAASTSLDRRSRDLTKIDSVMEEKEHAVRQEAQSQVVPPMATPTPTASASSSSTVARPPRMLPRPTSLLSIQLEQVGPRSPTAPTSPSVAEEQQQRHIQFGAGVAGPRSPSTSDKESPVIGTSIVSSLGSPTPSQTSPALLQRAFSMPSRVVVPNAEQQQQEGSAGLARARTFVGTMPGSVRPVITVLDNVPGQHQSVKRPSFSSRPRPLSTASLGSASSTSGSASAAPTAAEADPLQFPELPRTPKEETASLSDAGNPADATPRVSASMATPKASSLKLATVEPTKTAVAEPASKSKSLVPPAASASTSSPSVSTVTGKGKSKPRSPLNDEPVPIPSPIQQPRGLALALAPTAPTLAVNQPAKPAVSGTTVSVASGVPLDPADRLVYQAATAAVRKASREALKSSASSSSLTSAERKVTVTTTTTTTMTTTVKAVVEDDSDAVVKDAGASSTSKPLGFSRSKSAATPPPPAGSSSATLASPPIPPTPKASQDPAVAAASANKPPKRSKSKTRSLLNRFAGMFWRPDS